GPVSAVVAPQSSGTGRFDPVVPRASLPAMPSPSRERSGQHLPGGEAQLLRRAGRPPKSPVAHPLRAVLLLLRPDLRRRRGQALAAVEGAAILSLLLTLATLPGAAGESWLACLIALDGLLLLTAFLIALASVRPEGRSAAAPGGGDVILVAEG